MYDKIDKLVYKCCILRLEAILNSYHLWFSLDLYTVLIRGLKVYPYLPTIVDSVVFEVR